MRWTSITLGGQSRSQSPQAPRSADSGNEIGGGGGKPVYEPSGPSGFACPSFLSTKRLASISNPSGWDPSLSHGSDPPAFNSLYPFTLTHLGGERHCGSKVSCPTTQYNDPSQGLNPVRSVWIPAH